MTPVRVEWGPGVSPRVRAQVAPVLGRVGEMLDESADLAVVVGAPSAPGWGRVHAAHGLIAVSAGATEDDPFWAAARARADAVLDADGSQADLGDDIPVVDIRAVQPQPPAQAAKGVACDQGDVRAEWVIDTWRGLYPGTALPEVAVPIVVSSLGDTAVGAWAHAAWAAGAVPVILRLSGQPTAADVGPALVAHSTLEAVEAIDLIARSPRLGRALVRGGQTHLRTLPTPAEVALRVVDALPAWMRLRES